MRSIKGFIPIENVELLRKCTISPFMRHPLPETLHEINYFGRVGGPLDDRIAIITLYEKAQDGDYDAAINAIKQVNHLAPIRDNIKNMIAQWKEKKIPLDYDRITIVYPERINGKNKMAAVFANTLRNEIAQYFNESGINIEVCIEPAYQLQERGRSEHMDNAVLGPMGRFASPVLFKDHDIKEGVIIADHMDAKGTTMATLASYCRHYGRDVLSVACLRQISNGTLRPEDSIKAYFHLSEDEHNDMEKVLRKIGISLGKPETFEGATITNGEMLDIGIRISKLGVAQTIELLEREIESTQGIPKSFVGDQLANRLSDNKKTRR